MKKILLFAAAAIIAAGTLQAQNPDEVRIYLNPGHGSWGPNDRPMATIPYPMLSNGMPDTCGFYESNTNLWKILKMGETLVKMGVKKENIMYSRVKNGPYPYVSGSSEYNEFNRNLSEIAREVDANNMDMFVSIHSNAHVDGYTTNYPAFFFRGHDSGENPGAEGSIEMARKCWLPHYMDEIDPNSYYSRTSMCIRGDIDFWGGTELSTTTSKGTFTGYYGVLRHGTPGFLLEGYFHTYQPARHRALNPDYCGQEGVRTARGVQLIFNLNPEPTGYIMGTVKDLHEKMVHNLYTYSPGSIDQWVPLNGAKVDLLKDGQVVSTYDVDQNYNGVFVFSDLEPGKYTLRAHMDGYKAQGEYSEGTISSQYRTEVETSLGEYEVKANETTYARLYLEASSYEPPTVTYYNYPDPVQPGYATIADEYVFGKETQDYAIEGDVRRSIVRGDSIIVLAEKDGVPAIYLINGKTKQLVKQLSINGIAEAETNNTGFRHRLSDIAFTADGKLIGVNNTLCQINNDYVFDGETRGLLRFYKWNDFDSDPIEWTSTELSANWYRAYMGRTLAVSGSSNECTLVTTGTTAYSSTATRLFLVSMSNNQQTGTLFTEYNLNAEKQLSENKTGVDQQLMVSPLADDKYVMDGERTTPYELQPATTSNIDAEITGKVADDLLSKEGNGVGFFKYAGHALMVSPYVNENLVAGVKLFDVTDGLSNAKLINTIGTDLADAAPVRKKAEGNASLPYMAAGATVDGLDITIYLTVDNAITRFTTQGVQQPTVKGIFTYDLIDEEGDKQYTFNFKSNSDAESAKIIFTSKETGEVLGEVEVPNVKEGDNSITLTYDQMPGAINQEMNWAVNVTGKAITGITRLNDYATGDYSYNSQTRVVADNSPESDFFGRIYLVNYIASNNANNGLWVYTPDWTRLNSTRYNGNGIVATPFRIGIDGEGYVYVSDWSDPASGIYVVNPNNLDGDFTQFFEGTRNSASGIFTNNGVNVGGSSTSVWIDGTGADTKLYAHCEDDLNGSGGNNIAVYNIGQPDGTIKRTWGQAPDKMFNVGSKLVNGNVNVIADGRGGIWCSQLRYTPNNTVGVPSLIHANEAGTIDFNSGEEPFNTLIDGSSNSGFAISKDGKTLVINDDKSTLQFFDINWNSNGAPELTYKYSYMADCLYGRAIYQIDFDYGGNMLCAGGSLGIYSMPTDNNQTTTPAKKAYVVVKHDVTGVNTIDAVKRVANVRYVNVAGMVSDKPFDGVNIIVTTYTDSTVTTVKTVK